MLLFEENREYREEKPEEAGRRRHGEGHGRRHHHSEGGEDRRHGHHGHRGDGEDRGRGHHGGRQKHLSNLLEGKPDAMLLFVGAANCARHRADQMGELMRAGCLALLCPTAAEYATGRYLHQTVDAMVELSEKKGVKEYVVMYGCQWAVLSTDFDMIAQELKDNHGITATLDDTCHLCGNAQGGEDDHRERKETDE